MVTTEELLRRDEAKRLATPEPPPIVRRIGRMRTGLALLYCDAILSQDYETACAAAAMTHALAWAVGEGEEMPETERSILTRAALRVSLPLEV